MEPQLGMDYPIRLGPSLLGKRSAPQAGFADYCMLRYDFKPKSASMAEDGVLDVQPSNQKVSLQMGESFFAGKYEPSKDGLDCVAIFDGTTFRLELLGATVKSLKHLPDAVRAAKARSTTPQPAAGATAGQPQAMAAGPAGARAAPAPVEAAPSAGAAADGSFAAADLQADAGGQELAWLGSAGLEDELLRAFEEEDAAPAEPVEPAAWPGPDPVTAAPPSHPLAAAVQDEGSSGLEVGDEDEGGEGSSGLEDEDEGGEEGQEGGQDVAAALQQTAAAPRAAAPTAPVLPMLQPVPAAPEVPQEEMNEMDRLFFGFDSPEPPAQQKDSSSSDGGSAAVSEPEQEEI